MALTVVITYDISDNGARAKCAAMLQAVGDRVQRSVYACVMEEEKLAELMQRISALIDLEEDRVDVYRQCRTCWEDGMAIGLVAPRTITPYWAVF